MKGGEWKKSLARRICIAHARLYRTRWTHATAAAAAGESRANIIDGTKKQDPRVPQENCMRNTLPLVPKKRMQEINNVLEPR